MILIDYSQLLISVFFANGALNAPEENLLRHITLNTVRSYTQKFSNEYGQPVICADGKNSWRKQVFPYYKASRAKSREASPVDWKLVFDLMTKIYEELDRIPVYPCIKLDTVEADDIIAVLSEISYRNSEKTVIISSDHDFAQLQKYTGISQYSPVKAKFIKEPDPSNFLLEHIIRGDSGDGIPNIFSDDDSFVVEGKRQSSVSKNRIELFMNYIYTSNDDKIKEEWKRNFDRNKILIDFQYIPKDIVTNIKGEYTSKVLNHEPDKSKFLNYLIENKNRLLIPLIDEFFPIMKTKNSISNFFET